MRYRLELWKDDMGSFDQPGCRSVEDALWHVNSARDHDGLKPITLERLQAMIDCPTNEARAKMIPQY